MLCILIVKRFELYTDFALYKINILLLLFGCALHTWFHINQSEFYMYFKTMLMISSIDLESIRK